MKAIYPVRIEKEKEGEYLVQGLSPLDNVLTWGATLDEALSNAGEALTGILESMLDHGVEIPDPVPGRKEKDVYWIEPDLKVAVPILIRKARLESGLTLEELAGRIGVSYQQVQRWERPGTNPTIASLKKVFRALGKKIELSVA
ncbi:MAG: type II toxin-antitoxin system HicB family antitoxin [Nitrospirae bacterium]|nr:type II toxin-antitoxin system HicB family antitoxin [Nitrospirota bacterium]